MNARRSEAATEGSTAMAGRTMVVLELGAATGAAVLFKWYFASQPVERLRWLMEPVAWLVYRLHGVQWHFEPGFGYVSEQARYAIVAGCSGLTFLVLAFWVGVLTRVTQRQQPTAWRRWLSAGAAALGATLVTNTVRLTAAVGLHRNNLVAPGLDAGAQHRLLGMGIYLGCLWWLATRGGERRIAEPRLRSREPNTKALPLSVSESRGPTPYPNANRWRQAGLVLGSYVAMTVVLPALNGGLATPGFLAHAGWVLGLCGALGAAVALATTRARYTTRIK